MSENENTPPTPETDDVTKLQTELDKAKKDHLYLLADFDNYRKNAIKERSELTKYGSERLVREFLNVFDNFERALDSDSDNAQSFREGVQMIAGEIRALLQRFGVEELKSEGEAFDPSKHEALGNEPRGDLPAGHVARVVKKGYKMHDKLIRPAQVTVATGEKLGE
ncbi:MAG TPA: nucleotide exchange factor GrpE [Bdellovibrionales bacterium]|nr:nucleotide exchange factor GrpE [Bdellovibrionales bacterium]